MTVPFTHTIRNIIADALEISLKPIEAYERVISTESKYTASDVDFNQQLSFSDAQNSFDCPPVPKKVGRTTSIRR